MLVKVSNDIYFYEFNLNQIVTNNKVVINYYLQSPYRTRTHDGLVVEILTKKAVMTLSAANTVAGVLNKIMTVAISGVYNDVTDILKDDGFLDEAANALSKKYIGDLNQELGAITSNGGFYSRAAKGPGNAIYDGGGMQRGGGIPDPCVVLSNGDRPSTVRSSCLLEGCTGNVNPNSQILYATLFIKGPPSSATIYLTDKLQAPAVGGRRHKTKRITLPKPTLRKKKDRKRHKTRGKKKSPKIKSKARRSKIAPKKRRSKKNNKRH